MVIVVVPPVLVWLAFGWATASVGVRAWGSYGAWFGFGLLLGPLALALAIGESMGLPERTMDWAAPVLGGVFGLLIVAGWEAAGLGS